MEKWLKGLSIAALMIIGVSLLGASSEDDAELVGYTMLLALTWGTQAVLTLVYFSKE